LFYIVNDGHPIVVGDLHGRQHLCPLEGRSLHAGESRRYCPPKEPENLARQRFRTPVLQLFKAIAGIGHGDHPLDANRFQ
jgi:hypothetical protein